MPYPNHAGSFQNGTLVGAVAAGLAETSEALSAQSADIANTVANHAGDLAQILGGLLSYFI